MREIKFRAWDNIKKKMLQNTNLLYPAISLNGGIIAYKGDEKIPDTIAESRFILMQYTGLKDKNGKEIYEEDIFKGRDTFGSPHPDEFHSQRFVGKVIWDYCGFRVAYPLGKYDHNYSDFIDIDDIEIVGNIYENPELLTPNTQ